MAILDTAPKRLQLLGTARSGTSYLSDLVAHQHKMTHPDSVHYIEPFNVSLVDTMSFRDVVDRVGNQVNDIMKTPNFIMKNHVSHLGKMNSTNSIG